MTNRLEIEAAIKQLPDNDIRQLAAWLQDYLDEMWDRQIESDLTSGKLNTLIAKAEAAIAIERLRRELQEAMDRVNSNQSLELILGSQL